MGRKSNKNKLLQIKSEALSIRDLKEFIKDLSDEMLIGRSGHFGELNLCTKYDLTTEKGYITKDGYWKSKPIAEDIVVFSIQFEDIGPEPD